VVGDGRGDGARRGERVAVVTWCARDFDGQSVVGLHVGIVGTHEERCAVGAALANRNGDGLAVRERDDQGRTRDRTVEARRVDDRSEERRVGRGSRRDGGGDQGGGEGGGE